MNDFKILLDAVIDNSSLTEAQKKLAKERFKANLDVELDISKFASQKKKINDDFNELASKIKKAFSDIDIKLNDKQLTAFTNDYINTIKQASKEQEKLNNAQKKSDIKTQEKYYQRIIDNNKKINNLELKQIDAGERQKKVLQDQIDKLEKRNQYNYSQLDKKGLRNNDLEWDVNNSKLALDNQRAINDAKREDLAISKQIAEVDKIQLSLDTEKYSKDIKGISDELAKVGKFTLSDESNADIFKKANDSAKSLQTTYNQLKSTMTDTNATDQQKIDIEKKYQQELVTTKNLLSQINLSKDDEKVSVGDNRRVNMIATLNSYLAKNTAMTKDNKNQIESWIAKLGSSDDMTVGAIKNINSEFKQLDATLRQTGRLGLSMWDKFKQAVEKFGGWSLVTGAMTKVWQGMQNVYNEAVKLDGVMTDLAMATDLTASEMESLVDKYSDLGEELNATVSDVIQSGTEWIKQGQSIADTETLISNAMILSKIGKLSSAEATEYLTSAMKGYQVSAENTLGVVDKLSAVDMASATDVGGLAEGMSQVASSAELAGISMDKLLGYLATIGEVTQSGMSEVGTTLNAVFSRMGNIKLSRLTDYETGEDLSNVETVLRGVQISLRDTDESFRDFDEVLDETASRWDSFSETQQRAIASAFAGTRNQNEFIILMENYDKALQYTETSLNSSGEAMEKFGDYQKSVTAHTELFNKAIQDLANTAIDSGLVNFFIDMGTGAIKFLDATTKLLTPLGTLGVTLGAGLGIKNIGRPKMFGLVLKYADNYKCSLGY